MTRFNTYLTEGRSKSITEEEAIKLIKANCSDIVKQYKKTHRRIYRGKSKDVSSSSYQLVAPGRGKLRKSRNTRNYYTLLMDNLPAWKAYPKRSRSIVCSTDESKAGGYGTLYVVIPYNKAKIGTCPHNDIWDSTYEKFSINLNEFNRLLQDLLSASTNRNSKDFDKSWKSLQEIFFDSEARIQSFSWEIESRNRFILNMYWKLQEGKSYKEILGDIINPTILNFKLETPKTISLNLKNEVWVGKSSSVLIESDPLKANIFEDEILKKL